MNGLIEDVIAETAAEERKRKSSFTFAAIYAFVANAAHCARTRAPSHYGQNNEGP